MPTNGGHPPEEKVDTHGEMLGTRWEMLGTHWQMVGSHQETVAPPGIRPYSAGTPISFSSSGAG